MAAFTRSFCKCFRPHAEPKTESASGFDEDSDREDFGLLGRDEVPVHKDCVLEAQPQIPDAELDICAVSIVVAPPPKVVPETEFASGFNEEDCVLETQPQIVVAAPPAKAVPLDDALYVHEESAARSRVVIEPEPESLPSALHREAQGDRVVTASVVTRHEIETPMTTPTMVRANNTSSHSDMGQQSSKSTTGDGNTCNGAVAHSIAGAAHAAVASKAGDAIADVFTKLAEVLTSNITRNIQKSQQAVDDLVVSSFALAKKFQDLKKQMPQMLRIVGTLRKDAQGFLLKLRSRAGDMAISVETMQECLETQDVESANVIVKEIIQNLGDIADKADLLFARYEEVLFELLRMVDEAQQVAEEATSNHQTAKYGTAAAAGGLAMSLTGAFLGVVSAGVGGAAAVATGIGACFVPVGGSGFIVLTVAAGLGTASAAAGAAGAGLGVLGAATCSSTGLVTGVLTMEFGEIAECAKKYQGELKILADDVTKERDMFGSIHQLVVSMKEDDCELLLSHFATAVGKAAAVLRRGAAKKSAKNIDLLKDNLVNLVKQCDVALAHLQQFQAVVEDAEAKMEEPCPEP